MEIADRDTMKTFDSREIELYTMWLKIFEERSGLEPKNSKLEVKLKPKPLISINYSHQYKNWINFAQENDQDIF